MKTKKTKDSAASGKSNLLTGREDDVAATGNPGKPIQLGELLSSKSIFSEFSVWLIGDTPLITHAWSEKARREMLQKQTKAVKAGGKEARDPNEDFKNSLYEMGEVDGEKVYGFPTCGIKNCVLSAAHKDKGIPRSTVMAALWLNGQMVRTRTALAGAVGWAVCG